MIVLGMGYLVAARFLKRWHVEMPLTTSASIMVPTALVMMLLFGTGYAALTREGASAVLAAVFYAEAAWLEGNSGVRRLHAVLSYGLVPLGTVLLTYGLVHSAALCSFALTAVTFCQLFTVTSAPSLQRYERSFLRISAGSLAAGAIAAWTSGNWQLLAIILIADLLVTASIGILRADKLYTSLALIAFLILPAEVGRMASDPPLAGGILVSLYVAAAILLITAGHRLRPLGLSRLFVFGYSGALALAFAIGCSAGGGTAGLATAAVALCTIFCAYYERRPDVLLVSTVAGGVAVMQILGWHNWLTGSLISIALGGLGLAYYAANWTGQRLLNDIRYRQIWLVSGVTSLYVAALGGMGQGTIPWPSIVVLGFAGAITGYEARLRAHKGAIAVAAGVLTAAAQLALFKLGLREWQLYFYLWGMYAVYLAYYLVMPAAVYLSLIINGIGMAAGLLDHGTFSMRTMTIAVAVLAGGYYGIGKLRIVERHIERLNPLAETWLRAGIGGLFAAVLVSLLIGGYAPLDGSAYLPSALALLASGSLAAYETYLHHNREGLYVAGGIVLLGLEWLMYLSRIDHLQLYTHLWALYFALLAWFAHR
ncbi:MAG TPA: hypothetical protein VGS41_01075, partial [Chthonomonadales bacterium]|nr:hypothetical protein [Chthonomonadales bacterium]